MYAPTVGDDVFYYTAADHITKHAAIVGKVNADGTVNGNFCPGTGWQSMNNCHVVQFGDTAPAGAQFIQPKA